MADSIRLAMEGALHGAKPRKVKVATAPIVEGAEGQEYATIHGQQVTPEDMVLLLVRAEKAMNVGKLSKAGRPIVGCRWFWGSRDSFKGLFPYVDDRAISASRPAGRPAQPKSRRPSSAASPTSPTP